MPLYRDAIFTPRLKMRKMVLDDLSLLHAWSNDRDAYGKYLTPDDYDEEVCRLRLESGALWSERNKCFLLEVKDGKPIGTLHYWLRPERDECAVVQLKIACPELRGKGYGTEAQKYLIINLFTMFRVAEVEMYTDVNNTAQQRCLEKLGFEVVDSLSYEDHNIKRFGYLYRISRQRYDSFPVYHYHYE